MAVEAKINIGNREVTTHYLRRAVAIQKLADQMPNGSKYADIAELLSSFGCPIGEDAIKNYATDARRHLNKK